MILLGLILTMLVGVVAYVEGRDRGFDEGLDDGAANVMAWAKAEIERRDAERRKPRCPALLPFGGGGAVIRCSLADGHIGAHAS